jgi:hypothetical protein
MVAKDELIRVFLSDHTEPHHVRYEAIVFDGEIRMPRVLLDNGFPRKQDRGRAHRTDYARKRRVVEMAENNWLLSLQGQERPEVVYIHGLATKEYRPPTRANETGKSR